jgi:hypothetical protein
MADPLNRSEVKGAVRTLLRAVDGIGVVGSHVGAVAGWIQQPRGRVAYWEVSIRTAPLAVAAGRDKLRETLVLRVDGWLPISGTNGAPDGRSEAQWDELVPAVKAALVAARSVPDGGGDTDLPQESENDLVTFQDGERAVGCHHVLFEWPVRQAFAGPNA